MRTLVGSVFGVFVTAGCLSAAEAVDYAKDVKPILAKNCFSCHGGGKAKGKLRVDSMASMLKGGESGPAVVPGKAKDSTLVQSLTGDGDIRRMPPKRALTRAEIDTIKKWVETGAKAPKDEPGVAAANPPGRRPFEGDRRRRMREREREREQERERGKRDDDRKKDDDKKEDGKKKDDDRKENGKKKDDDRKKGDRKLRDDDD
jgi:mono/diheme cytochrome c family protein